MLDIVLCLLQCPCHCVPWISSELPNLQELRSSMELRAPNKNQEPPIAGQSDTDENIHLDRAICRSGTSPRLGAFGRLLVIVRLKKPRLNLESWAKTLSGSHLALNQSLMLAVVPVVSCRH